MIKIENLVHKYTIWKDENTKSEKTVLDGISLDIPSGQFVAILGPNGEIAAAGLDVLSAEPMSEKNPLIKIQDSRRLFITPHIAWASVEARTRLMQIILDQVKEYFHM